MSNHFPDVTVSPLRRPSVVSSRLRLIQVRFAMLKQGGVYNDIIWTDVVGFFSTYLFLVSLAFLDYPTSPNCMSNPQGSCTQIAQATGVCIGLIATLVLVVVELLRTIASIGIILVPIAILLIVQLVRPLFGFVMCTQLIVLVHA